MRMWKKTLCLPGAIIVVITVIFPIVEVCGPSNINLTHVRLASVTVVVDLQLLGCNNYRCHDGDQGTGSELHVE